MSDRLVLLGGGGHASDVLAVVEALGIGADGRFRSVSIADDAWSATHRFETRAVDLVDGIDRAAETGPYVVAVGYPGSRRALDERATAAGGQVAEPLVHPASSVGTTTVLGPGCVVMGQTWLSAGVELGRHVHVSYGTTIGHDTTIGDYGAVMPSAAISGDVTIGDGVLIGTNATVLQGLTIGDGAVIGAGAIVTRDVESGVTVVGSPARPRPSI